MDSSRTPEVTRENLDRKLEKLYTHVDHRFDRLETKLDAFSDRTIKNEEAIMWIKGHVKIVTTFAITIAGAIATYFLSLGGS